jgi:pimeloyl-ACP methyl ester carboxylesterase
MMHASLALPDRGIEVGLVDFGGEGPLAVVSHANGFCASLYEPLAAGLRDRYRVLAFDSRGHGRSSAPPPSAPYEWEEFVADWRSVAAALCERAGVERVGLGVGHSFGGSCLLAAAAREPERFESIALIDPVLLPPPGERTGPFMGEGDHPMSAAARRRTAVFPSRDAIRASWSRRGVFADWDPAVLEAYLRDGFRDREDGRVELCCAPEIEAAVFQLGPRLDLFADLPALQTPTLWLHAGQGNFSLDLVERAAASSDAVLLESLDVDHLVAMTAPDLVVSRVLDWIDTQGSGATAASAHRRG